MVPEPMLRYPCNFLAIYGEIIAAGTISVSNRSAASNELKELQGGLNEFRQSVVFGIHRRARNDWFDRRNLHSSRADRTRAPSALAHDDRPAGGSNLIGRFTETRHVRVCPRDQQRPLRTPHQQRGSDGFARQLIRKRLHLRQPEFGRMGLRNTHRSPGAFCTDA